MPAKKEKYDINKQARSFVHAWNGVKYFVRTEPKALIHFTVYAFAIGLAIYLDISHSDWALLTLSMGGLLAMELVNTALEELCDFLHPEIHPSIKVVKDISSGAVLVIAIATAIVSLTIFQPYI